MFDKYYSENQKTVKYMSSFFFIFSGNVTKDFCIPFVEQQVTSLNKSRFQLKITKFLTRSDISQLKGKKSTIENSTVFWFSLYLRM